MRARFTFFVMLILLLFAAVLITAQSGADPAPRCVQIGRGPAGPLAEIQCREDALQKTAAPNPQIAPMLFWLADAYDKAGINKAEEHYRKLVDHHCADDQDLCQKARKRLEVLRRGTLIEVPTPFTPNAYNFAISPDGKRIVYVATVDGKTGLWLRHLDSGKSALIPGTDRLRFIFNWPNGAYPFWSPDGKSIAFFADNKLQRIDEGGGNLIPLADVKENGVGSWAGDVILYSPSNGSAVYSVPASGGAAKPVTRPTGSASHRYPQFLPDSRHFLFFPGIGEGLAIGSLDGPEVKHLGISSEVARFAPPDQLLYLSKGVLYAQRLDLTTLRLTGNQVRLAENVATNGSGLGAISVAAVAGTIAYRADAVPRTQLFWFDRQGRRIASVGQPGLSTGSPRISPDGRTVALYNAGTARLTDLESRDGTFRSIPYTTGARGGGWTQPPVWSPDGLSLAFAFTGTLSQGRGGYNVHRLNLGVANGPKTEVLIRSDKATTPRDWSRDGVLLFFKGPPGSGSLFARSANGGAEILIAENTSWGRFSPDGKWIAYETGGHVYIQPFPGSVAERLQVSDKGNSPEWSSESPELFFLSADNHLMVAAVRFPDAAGPMKVLDVKLLSAAPLPEGSTYAPAPDGQRFLVLASAPPEPIFVLSNWTPSKDAAPAPPLTLTGGSAPEVNGSVATAPRGASGPSATQLRQIVVYDRAGKFVTSIGDIWPDPNASSLSLSPDGTRIATIKNGVVSVIDIASNTTIRLAADAAGMAAWSPDGRRIAYISNRVPRGIYVKASNGEGTEEWFAPHGNLWNWSLDGRFIGLHVGNLFTAMSVMDRKLVPVVPADGKGAMRLSPDSGFVAYLSNEGGGGNQVFVRRFDPDDLDSVSYRKIKSGGTAGMIRWRFDGKELYHIASDGGVMAIPIETTPRIQQGTAVELFHVPPDFPVQSGLSGGMADVSADGQRFVFLLPIEPKPPQQLVTKRDDRAIEKTGATAVTAPR